jgi:hypothetical protein
MIVRESTRRPTLRVGLRVFVLAAELDIACLISYLETLRYVASAPRAMDGKRLERALSSQRLPHSGDARGYGVLRGANPTRCPGS